jgi:hypothetical protein
MDSNQVIVSRRHRLTQGVVTGAMLRHLVGRMWWMLVGAWVLALSLAGLAVSLGKQHWMLTAMVAALLPLAFPVLAWRAASRGMRLFSIERWVRIGPDGLETTDSRGNEGMVTWDQFTFARRTSSLWMLYLSTGAFVMLPDYAIEEPDRPSLDALIRSKLAVKGVRE